MVFVCFPLGNWTIDLCQCLRLPSTSVLVSVFFCCKFYGKFGKPDGLVILSWKFFPSESWAHRTSDDERLGCTKQPPKRKVCFGCMKPLGDWIPRVLGTRLGLATPFFRRSKMVSKPWRKMGISINTYCIQEYIFRFLFPKQIPSPKKPPLFFCILTSIHF